MVKRYNPGTADGNTVVMVEHPYGRYIVYHDYENLISVMDEKADEIRMALDEIEGATLGEHP
jgi:hypothetical protein